MTYIYEYTSAPIAEADAVIHLTSGNDVHVKDLRYSHVNDVLKQQTLMIEHDDVSMTIIITSHITGFTFLG